VNITGSIFLRFLLIFPMFFFYAAALLAEVCDENPIACTPAELCLRTTELLDGTRYWIEDEANEYLQVSRQYGLDCKAQKALSPCEKDPNVCSILQLCEISTTLSNSAKKWSSSNQDHVKLAKSYGLTCGVSAVQTSSLTQGDPVDDLTKCENDLKNCTSDKLCELSTWGPSHNKQWKVGRYVKFVDEAKRRNILCGVASNSKNGNAALAQETPLTACDKKPAACISETLCEKATMEVSGKLQWQEDNAADFVQEAKKRNLSCGILPAPPKTPDNAYTRCENNLQGCAAVDLCEAATWGLDTKKWKVGSFKKYVDEAKRRNISCSVPAKNENFDKNLVSKPPLSACDKKPAACITETLCDKATIKVNGKLQWHEDGAADFVQEAKKRNLSCDVLTVAVQKSDNAYTRCEANLSGCKDVDLCTAATWGPSHNKQWKVGRYVKFVDEAKRRNILCGVAEANILEDCKATPETCTDSNLCKYATYNVDGITRWKGPIFRILVDEAKKRGLSCSVSSSMKVKTDAASPKSPHEKCRDNLENCNDQTLCKLATIGNIQKYFDKNRYPDLVTEAKKRGLTCGVIETTAQATITQQKTSKQISTFLSFLKGKTFAENRYYCFTVPRSFDDKGYYSQGRKGSERNYQVISKDNRVSYRSNFKNPFGEWISETIEIQKIDSKHIRMVHKSYSNTTRKFLLDKTYRFVDCSQFLNTVKENAASNNPSIVSELSGITLGDSKLICGAGFEFTDRVILLDGQHYANTRVSKVTDESIIYTGFYNNYAQMQKRAKLFGGRKLPASANRTFIITKSGRHYKLVEQASNGKVLSEYVYKNCNSFLQ